MSLKEKQIKHTDTDGKRWFDLTLYEIDQQIVKAIELGYDPETGEILDDTALRDLEMARDEKIENICLFIKDLKAESAAIKAEKESLDERQRASDRKAESLSNYLQVMLNGEKFKSAKCAVSYRKVSSVQIIDENMIPEELKRKKVIIEPDKKAIKERIKEGFEIAGARLEERQSMSIK